MYYLDAKRNRRSTKTARRTGGTAFRTGEKEQVLTKGFTFVGVRHFLAYR